MNRYVRYQELLKKIREMHTKSDVADSATNIMLWLLEIMVRLLFDILQQLVRLNMHLGTERAKGDAKSD